jgi:hypothetical protein
MNHLLFRAPLTLALCPMLGVPGARESAPHAMPCAVVEPGVVCGVTVSINPFVPNGGPFGGFQSAPGTSYQSDVVITFSEPVQSVTVTELDPDYTENQMIAYEDKTIVARTTFEGDNAPNVLTSSTRTLQACNITRIVLHPDPADYVAYRGVNFEKELPPKESKALCAAPTAARSSSTRGAP